MIKKVLTKYSISIDDLFLFSQLIFVNIAIFSVLIKNNKIASAFFYVSIIFSFLWFVYKFIVSVVSIFKKRANKLNVITSIIVLLLYSISIIITSIFIIKNNYDFLSKNNYEKLLLYLSAINFIYCSVNSKFNRAIFYEALFFAEAFLLLSVALFVIGPARTWGSYGKWKNLTLNFINPNLAGLILFIQSLIVLAGFFVCKTKYAKIIISLTLVFALILLYLTSSRTFLIALAFAFLFYLLKRFVKNRKMYSVLISLTPLLFPLIYIFISYLVQLNTAGNLQIAIYLSSGGKSLGTRITMWLWPLKIVSEKPFFGSFIDSYTGHYHNTMIDSWITYGGIYTSLFILLISISLYTVFSKKETNKFNILFFCYVAALMTMISETTILYSSLGTSCLFLIFIPFSKMDLESCFEIYSKEKKECDVLILTNVFGVGSIGKMTKSIFSYCDDRGMEVCVLYGRGDELRDKNNVIKCCTEFESGLSKLLSKMLKNIYSFNLFSTLNVIDFIKKSKVKVVNIHAINDYFINPYLLFKYLKKNNIKIIYTAHSGNLILSNCGGNTFECPHWKENPGCHNCILPNNRLSSIFWKKMYSILKNYNNFSVVTVSNFLKKQYQSSKITLDKNIITIPDCVSDSFKFRDTKININMPLLSKKVLLVTPSIKNPNKGFGFFENISKKMPDVTFICASYDIKQFSKKANLYLLPSIKNEDELSKLYSSCDLTLILSKSETFSLPVAESLSSGTPVVGFVAGGPEEIAISEYSSFVKYGDIYSLMNEIKRFLNTDFDKEKISIAGRKKYSQDAMNSSYYDIYRKMLPKYPKRYEERIIEIDI